jgi:hypothetical protein
MKEGSMGLPKSMNAKGSLAKGTIGLLLVCVAAAAMLLAARRPVQMDKTLMPPARGVAASVVQPKATVATNSNSKKVKPAGAPVTATVVATPAAPEMAAEKETTAALKAPVAEATSATIAGCLERDGDSFVMKANEGDAPKARSWKSGFLKKGAPRIEIMDASNRLKLSDHVGHKVSISGMLADREMQARSLKRVSSSCE